MKYEKCPEMQKGAKRRAKELARQTTREQPFQMKQHDQRSKSGKEVKMKGKLSCVGVRSA